MIYIGLDDTDTVNTPGTGHLARLIAADLSATFPVAGVTGHQLLVDPRVPYTAKNSSVAIFLPVVDVDLHLLQRRVAAIVLDNCAAGSDPGLAVAAAVTEEVIHFGRRAQRELLTQTIARRLADAHSVLLSGLRGSQDGVIGTLVAVGLTACGDDGRYVLVGRSRDLHGLVPVGEILGTGIAEVRTLAGQHVSDGQVLAEKLRLAPREGRPILFVQRSGGTWQPLKLD